MMPKHSGQSVFEVTTDGHSCHTLEGRYPEDALGRWRRLAVTCWGRSAQVDDGCGHGGGGVGFTDRHHAGGGGGGGAAGVGVGGGGGKDGGGMGYYYAAASPLPPAPPVRRHGGGVEQGCVADVDLVQFLVTSAAFCSGVAGFTLQTQTRGENTTTLPVTAP